MNLRRKVSTVAGAAATAALVASWAAFPEQVGSWAIPPLSIAAWWAVGIAGGVYWQSRQEDVTAEALLIHVLAGLLGPLNWAFSWCMWGMNGNRVLVRKRSDKRG